MSPATSLFSVLGITLGILSYQAVKNIAKILQKYSFINKQNNTEKVAG